MADETRKLEVVEPDLDNDPFDLSKLRVSQDYLETANVKKPLLTVPVRKPNPQDFFRVNPHLAYRDLLAVLELKEEREVYLVDLRAVPELANECVVVNLFTCCTRAGTIFLWPARVPAADGRTCEWHISAAQAASLGMNQWIRLKANMNLQAYEVFTAANSSTIPEPEWPAETFQQLCRIGFRDRLVNHRDHPILKRLRGG